MAGSEAQPAAKARAVDSAKSHTDSMRFINRIQSKYLPAHRMPATKPMPASDIVSAELIK